MIKDSFFFAIKNLKHRGLRSWLTLLGIFVGVTAVVALISLGNGLQLAVSSQFGISETELITIEAGGVNGMGPPGSGVVDPLTVDDLEAVENLGSVKRAVRRNIKSGKLEYNDHVVFGFAASIPSGKDRDFIYEQLGTGPVVGRFTKDSDVGKIFVGYNFYVNKVGLDKKVTPGKKVLVQDKQFEVVGILDKKGSFILDNAIYMNEKDMEDLFGYGNKVDIILAQPTDKREISRTKEDVEKLLRKRRDVKEGEEDFSVSTPEASIAMVNGILGGVQAFIVLIASISIFIGALGIVNTMTTSVIERRKDIGIMKSIGATNSHIFLQFFLESSLLGLIGGLVGSIVGTLIGILGTSAINNFIGAEIRSVINFSLIGFTLLGSFLLGGIAGIIPAMNAAKKHPVEALRS